MYLKFVDWILSQYPGRLKPAGMEDRNIIVQGRTATIHLLQIPRFNSTKDEIDNEQTNGGQNSPGMAG